MKVEEPLLAFDKTAFSIASLDDESDEKSFRLSRTPQERLLALEYMRQVAYGYDPDTERLQRVFEIIKL
jgi:hypothetical protein